MKNQSTHVPSVNLMFLGGVGDDVTGSSTLISLEIEGEKHYGLIDVGGHQGEGNRNFYFPVKGSKIDFIIITHAHYDHIGLLPKLYKEGFAGKVFITEQAKANGILILKDAAKINKENSEVKYGGEKLFLLDRKACERKKSKLVNHRDLKNICNAISQLDDILSSALYDITDVENVKKLFVTVKPNIPFDIYEGKLFAKLVPTTHQNGAIQLELYYKNADETIGLLFSGDIGPKDSLLYEPRRDDFNSDIDYGIIESLHGIEEPIETIGEAVERLEKIIKDGLKNKKNIILVGFSLERNAMLVYLINEVLKKGEWFDAYFDAPLALSMLQHYQRFYERERELRRYSSDVQIMNNLWFKNLGDNPFSLDKFNVIKNKSHHVALINSSAPKVVITSSANGNGGRVVDYFDKYIQDGNTVFVFCGWIYPGSPSQILHDTPMGGLVDLGFSRYKKLCQTIRIHGLSSHGYFKEILNKLYSYPKMKEVILNHGNMDAKCEIKERLYQEFKVKAHIPLLYDAYSITKETITKLDGNGVLEEFGEIILQNNMDMILREESSLMKDID